MAGTPKSRRTRLIICLAVESHFRTYDRSMTSGVMYLCRSSR